MAKSLVTKIYEVTSFQQFAISSEWFFFTEF